MTSVFRFPIRPVSDADGPSSFFSPFRVSWPGVLRVAVPLSGLAAGASLLLPPHTHEAKANELALFYGFTGLWAVEKLLHRPFNRQLWILLSLVCVGLLFPRFLGVAPHDVGPSATPPWPPYSFRTRVLQLIVATGVGFVGLLGARVLLAAAERMRWPLVPNQLRRRPVFLLAASTIALAVSLGQPVRVVSGTAFWLLIGYSEVWSISPIILRLLKTRPFIFAALTIVSTAGSAGLIAANLLGTLPGKFDPSGFILVIIINGLGAVGLTGLAVWAAEVIIRAASRLGGLPTRFCMYGWVVTLLVAQDPTQFLWPISVRPLPIPGAGHYHWEVSFNLALIVVVATALVGRLARDLGTAGAQFRAIASGDLPRRQLVPGHEESSRLLQRIAHLSAQLSKPQFLETINGGIRARTEELKAAVRRLNETNTRRVQTERFSAIAGIVATASHELRNPIAQIAGNLPLIRSYVDLTAQRLRRFKEARSEGAELLAKSAERLSASGRDVEESARRAALVLGDLNAISATPLRALESVDLRSVIERSVRLTPRSPGVRVHCELEPVPSLTARAGEIEQVVVNLIENAVDAVSPEGTVFVRLRQTPGGVLLEVEDDGPGMRPDVLTHATEPFFTTKTLGKGSGLGLAIVSSIVRAHHGTLELQSTEGEGTRVDVRLPLPEEARA